VSGFSEEWLADYEARRHGLAQQRVPIESVAQEIERPGPFFANLSLPPSVNGAWANVEGVGRRKTSAYRAWIKTAKGEISAGRQAWRPIEGAYKLTIVVRAPAMDIDNVVKPISDLLQKMGMVRNDRNMTHLEVARADGPRGVSIQVTPL